MFKSISFRNFYGFKEGVNIDFTLSDSVPESIQRFGGCTPVLGIKGANGSGKTNLLKAISFIRHFAVHSYDESNDEEIAIHSFYDNEEPIEFEIVIVCDEGVEFIYELSLTKREVLNETIYKKSTRKTKIIERNFNEIVYSRKDLKEFKKVKLRSNASILAALDKYKFDSEMSDLRKVHFRFLRVITNVSKFGLFDNEKEVDEISEEYSKDEALFDFVKNIISYADSGIKDIIIESFIDRKDNKEVFFPIFIHGEGKTKPLTYFDESSGTKALYQKLYYYWLVLNTGGLLALDEFDIHMHALILPKIIELFTNKGSNKTEAQFIFTAHNTEIIDSLGKYRTILVNKIDNESYCYRLDEIPGSMVRNDRSIVPLYLQGKIGGIPGNV